MLIGDNWILCDNENGKIIAAIVGKICDDSSKSEQVFAEVELAIAEILRGTTDKVMRYDSDTIMLMCWPRREDGLKVINVYKNIGCLWTDDERLYGMVGNPN